MPRSKLGFILYTCIFSGLFIFFNLSATNATGKHSSRSLINNQNPIIIYDDELASDWELATNDSRTDENLAHANLVQSGSYSIHLEVIEDWGTFNLKPIDGAIQLNEYKALRFWIYTDNRIQLKLKDGNGEYTALEVTEFRNDVALPSNEWTLIEADLSRYSAVGTQFTELRWMGFGDRQPLFYLDQIELIPADSVPVDFPSSDNEWIYYDLLANDWEVATDDNRTNKDWAEPNIVYSGNRSIKLEVIEDWGAFSLKPKSGAIQLSDYQAIRFWIYTDNRIQLKLRDGTGPYTTLEVTEFRDDVPLPPNEWTLIEADLNRYSSDVSQFTELLWMGFGDKQPTFHLDQVELIRHDAIPQNTPTPTATISTPAANTPTSTLVPIFATNTPTPTPISNSEYAISINDGKIFTRRSEVTLHFTAPASTTHVKISNDGGFSGSEWQPYSETMIWEIDSFLNFLLPRIVYVRFKDIDGSTTNIHTDDIILDVLAPWGNGRATKTNNTVRLKLEADDDVSGIDQFRLSNERNFANSTWQTFEQGIEINLGNLTVESLFLQLSDKAENISDPIEVKILTDKVYLPLIAEKENRR